MAGKPKLGANVVDEWLDRPQFKDVATLTVAKAIYRENKELWSSLEACRSAVRKARGNMGTQNRQTAARKNHYRENGKAGTSFESLPEGIVQLEDFGVFQIDGPCTILRLSDTHIPYHNKQAIQLACDYAGQVDIIDLCGDIIDCFAQSNFVRDPREVDFKAEVDATKAFFAGLRKQFPNARIIYKWGNHEQRFQRYMWVKAAELLDIKNCQLDAILDCVSYGIETVEKPIPIRFGKLFDLHGHEWKEPWTNPVNPARGLYLRAKMSCMAGHHHQTSQHSEPRLDGHVVSCWTAGCLCDTHPRYAPINRYNRGFIAANIDTAGAFQVENLRIIDGKVW